MVPALCGADRPAGLGQSCVTERQAGSGPPDVP